MPRKTLADFLAENETLSVHCQHPACFNSRKLDVAALAERLGPDHGAMHDDLVKLFRCTKCEAEGRPRLPVRFTCVPDYVGIQRRKNTTSPPSPAQ